MWVAPEPTPYTIHHTHRNLIVDFRRFQLSFERAFRKCPKRIGRPRRFNLSNDAGRPGQTVRFPSGPDTLWARGLSWIHQETTTTTTTDCFVASEALVLETFSKPIVWWHCPNSTANLWGLRTWRSSPVQRLRRRKILRKNRAHMYLELPRMF